MSLFKYRKIRDNIKFSKNKILSSVRKEERAITLIALVITIIVLLILAAVSIATLTGENGILTQANRAKTETVKAGAKEKVQLEVAGSYDQTGKVNLDLLNDNLKNNIKDITYKGVAISDSNKIESLPAKVSVDGVEVIINAKATVENLGDWRTARNETTGEIEVINQKTNLKLTVGDYIDYNHLAGVNTADNNVIKVTSFMNDSGYTEDQVFDITKYTEKWRILGEENGKLLIISDVIIGPEEGGYVNGENKYFYLYGRKGYENAITELDKISAKYGQGNYAEEARSITIDDVNKITGYNPNNEGQYDPQQTGSGTKFDENQLSEYGNEVTYYWDGTNKPYYMASNESTPGNLGFTHSTFWWYDRGWKSSLKDSTATTSNRKEITKLKSNFYHYGGSDNGLSTSSKAYDMLFTKGYYCLGSRWIYTDTNWTDFGVHDVEGDYVYRGDLANSQGKEYINYFGIRPVIYLKSDINLTQDETGTWQIS